MNGTTTQADRQRSGMHVLVQKIRPPQIFGLMCVLLLAGILSETNRTFANENVRVVLVNGRVLQGQVDSRTDDRFLWIGLRADRIEFASKHNWASVQSIHKHGEPWSRDEILQSMDRAESPHALSPSSWDEGTDSPRDEDVSASRQQDASFAVERLPSSDVRPRSLVVRANLANWDSDPLPDGLIVEIAALNRFGVPVPVQGHIEFQLMVAFDDLGTGFRNAVPPTFRVVERSSARLPPENPERGSMTVRLPFRTDTWYSDVGIAPIGLVHARMSVPGMGVLEATDDQVILKNCNPLRDQLQYYLGNRFLSGERAGF